MPNHLSGRVLVTGGSGFIARALYLRARRENWPVEFTAMSRDDHKHARLAQRFPEVRFVAMDVRADVSRQAALFRGHDTVIHAAASKHVDLAEFAAWETAEVNIEGSQRVAIAAIEARVSRVIGISTDKACQPANQYGLTKAVMERLLQEADGMSDTAFTLVRYGNVIGSTGSVVPKFRDLIARGLPIHLTNPEMTRFWMGHEEAVDTILYGLTEAERGTITIPRPRAMSLYDLARTALDIVDDTPIDPSLVVVDGARPGEKMHEELISMAESLRVVSSLENRYYEIAAPAASRTTARYQEVLPPLPFRVGSDAPPAGWVKPSEMRTLMASAEEV